jgi:hypothetical protein
MKMMKVHVSLWIILLVVGFLGGFVPEYLKNRELRRELENPQKTIDSLQFQVQMGELRDLASLMLVELSRQNYGLAKDYSTQYYSKLKDAIAVVQDVNLKQSLDDLAKTQDSVTTGLAAANPTSFTGTLPIVSRTFEVTRNAK